MTGGSKGVENELKAQSLAHSLDSRLRGNDPPEADREFERCQSRSPTDQVRGRLHPLPSGETELHNGCAEGQSPFAEVLGVSPSFLFSPKSGG